MNSKTAVTILIVLFLLVALQPAQAVIKIGGDNNFRNHVLGCFERYQAAGGKIADVLNQLNQPSPSAHTVTIQPGVPGGFDSTSTGTGGHMVSGGRPGPGDDSTITHNPDIPPFIPPLTVPGGIPRDPCSSLFHELKHAAQADKGTWSNGRHGTSTGIQEDEVQATTEENRYRDSQNPPLPQRPGWGTPGDIPPDAIHPR